MGRSPRFCLSIKACAGSPPVDADDPTLLESKASPEKRRWSFRKKHIGHHTPSNNINSEPLHILRGNQYHESTSDTLHLEKAPSEPEKASIVEQTTSTLISPIVSSKIPKELTNTATVGVDYSIPENFIIVIQTSIRRCLAKKELQKLKKLIKIQAVARGYLVRRQAAGTLRCFQAIVKMQALVRARRSDQSMDLIEKNKSDEYIPAEVKLSRNKTSPTIRKSVSSAFARQLLESTPKAKSIRISCDPLRPDSAWTWFERWMALTSTSQQNLILNQDDLNINMKKDQPVYDADVRLHIVPGHTSSDSELASNSLEVPEFEGDQITNSSMRVEFLPPACVSDQYSTSSVPSVDMENLKYHSKRGAKEGSGYISRQMQQPSDASLHFELNGNLNKPDYSEDSFTNNGTKELNEAPEIGSKTVNGSRKLLNPAFAVIQGKFEDLSTAPGSNGYSDYTSQDVVSASSSTHSEVNFTSNEVSATKSVHSMLENKLDEVNMNEKLSNPNPEGQFTSSEYGTEISVSSLDRQEAAASETVQEIKTLDETNLSVKGVADGSLKFKETKTETEKNGATSVDSVEAMHLLKQPTEIVISNIQTQEKVADDTYVGWRSPNGSSGSHTNFPVFPTTPPNQVSLRVRTSKAEDNISAKKNRSQLSVKTPTSTKSDSEAQITVEHLLKGTKNVKRPNSSGDDKANHIGHKDRNSCNSLPNYMQPTESAKAKVNMSFYHKLDVGVHHKDNHIKKRHSLPIGNEKQGLSPKVQSSKAQTPPASKGNNVSFRNSTERRWQI